MPGIANVRVSYNVSLHETHIGEILQCRKIEYKIDWDISRVNPEQAAVQVGR